VQAAKGPVSAWLLPAGWFRNPGNCADGYLQCWRWDWKGQEEAQACSLRLGKQGVCTKTGDRWRELADGRTWWDDFEQETRDQGLIRSGIHVGGFANRIARARCPSTLGALEVGWGFECPLLQGEST
jgi:hypothetical protein